jgi:nicotinate phosphoribosyltransferase
MHDEYTRGLDSLEPPVLNEQVDKPSSDELALLTDFYQLTMAYAYEKAGLGEAEGVFHLFFRRNPFEGGYAVAAGLEPVIDLISKFRFSPGDLAYLETIEGNDGRPIFDRSFLDKLSRMRFGCDLDMVPEGTVVFPFEPILRVRGPLVQAQILETPLLNLVNFQTLVATKAARVCDSAAGKPVLEFGLRRAQGVDGGLAASRAAFIGGCTATSNVLAGRRYGIPVRGTHAHSWVMAFPSELEAFETYAGIMPNNSMFLVDTYDTIQGVRNAVEVGKTLRARGHEMIGIRLDSGDLAYLSIEARKILDEAGFPTAEIIATNDLDEHIIESLHQQGAQIGVWGVGTRLVTAHDQPALGGVYKLSALKKPGGEWVHKLKLSEQAIKISTPGVLQTRRFSRNGEAVGDMIWNETQPPGPPTMVDPMDHTRRKTFRADDQFEDLLVPVFRRGERVYDPPTLVEMQGRTRTQLASFHAGVRRFVYPHRYPVGLERQLHDLKTRLILEARGVNE